jgi:hypothetical protein
MEGGQTNSRREGSQSVSARYRPRVQRRAAVVIALTTMLAMVLAASAPATTPKTPAQVVRAWSKALDASDDKAAGALFAANALTIQGAFVVRLKTAKSAVLWNSGLPCAGEIVRLRVAGNVVKATFVLGHRKGHKCDAPGQLAAAKFTVVKGKITRWEQVAPDPTGPVA